MWTVKRLGIVTRSLVPGGIIVLAVGVSTLLRIAHNISYAPDIVMYYAECKKDGLSEAAFLCAAEVFAEYRSKEYAQWFDALLDTNKVNATTHRKAIERFIDEHRKDIFSRVNGKKEMIIAFIGTLANPGTPSDEKEWTEKSYDFFLRFLRQNCYFRKGHNVLIEFAPDAPREMVHEYLEKRSSYSIEDGIEDGLRQIDPLDAEFIIQCHKIIIKDWRKQCEICLRDNAR